MQPMIDRSERKGGLVCDLSAATAGAWQQPMIDRSERKGGLVGDGIEREQSVSMQNGLNSHGRTTAWHSGQWHGR